MALSGSYPKTISLHNDSRVAIDIISEGPFTSYILVKSHTENKIFTKLIIDPTDNTVFGAITNDINLDEKEVKHILPILSAKIREHLGAKEFIIVPETYHVEKFKTPEATTFDRLRYSSWRRLNWTTHNILKLNPELRQHLDKHYRMIKTEEALMQGMDSSERYAEIGRILGTTGFTAGKQKEYEQEELNGKMSRFKNDNVKFLIMVDNNNKIVGMIRGLLRNGFCYLSDEVINQDLLEFNLFPGKTEEEQKAKRQLFLFSYLINAATCLDSNFLIIAAKGREPLYNAVGFNAFPGLFQFYVDGRPFKTVMSLGEPGPTLKLLQENIRCLPAPTSEAKPVPAPAAPQTNYWRYAKYGVTFAAVGLFAYTMIKRKGITNDAGTINTLIPKLK